MKVCICLTESVVCTWSTESMRRLNWKHSHAQVKVCTCSSESMHMLTVKAPILISLSLYLPKAMPWYGEDNGLVRLLGYSVINFYNLYFGGSRVKQGWSISPTLYRCYFIRQNTKHWGMIMPDIWHKKRDWGTFLLGLFHKNRHFNAILSQNWPFWHTFFAGQNLKTLFLGGGHKISRATLIWKHAHAQVKVCTCSSESTLMLMCST